MLNGSLEALYREDRRRLFTLALALTRSPERAEDAVQEAFARLFRLETAPRNLRAYVFRTVRNSAIDQVRRQPPPTEEIDDFIFDPSPGPREEAGAHELQRRVAQGLLALSDNEREIVVMRLYGELTFREIANAQEAPMGTVTSWYRRGIEKLRRELGEE